MSPLESSSPVYNLAALWRMNSGSIPFTFYQSSILPKECNNISAVVRVLHIAALIDKGGSRDDDAAAMVPQVAAKERNLLLDATTCCLRMRLGLAIARVEKLSAFGSLISLMDSQVV